MLTAGAHMNPGVRGGIAVEAHQRGDWLLIWMCYTELAARALPRDVEWTSWKDLSCKCELLAQAEFDDKYARTTNQKDAINSSKNLEDYWISSVGKTLYGKFVDGYSKKMWQIDDNKEIDYFSHSKLKHF